MKKTIFLILLSLSCINLFAQWNTEQKEGFDFSYKGAYVHSSNKNGLLKILNYGSKDKPNINISLKFEYKREAGFVPYIVSFRFNNSSTVYSIDVSVINSTEYFDNPNGVTIQKSVTSLNAGNGSITIMDFIKLLKENQKIFCRVEENSITGGSKYDIHRYDLEFTLSNSTNALNFIL